MKKAVLVAVIMVFMLALATAAFADAEPKESICHYTANGEFGEVGAEYNVIEVGASAVAAHLAHGDAYWFGDHKKGRCRPPKPQPEPEQKQLLCHYTANGEFRELGAEFNVIEVNENAVAAHLDHGDAYWYASPKDPDVGKCTLKTLPPPKPEPVPPKP